MKILMNFIKELLIINKFKNHNKKIFKDNLIKKNGKKYNILLEFNAFNTHHIIFSYLVNYFKKKYYCNFYAYPSHMLLSYEIEKNKINKIKKFFAILFNLKTYGIYKSFGVNTFIDFKITKEIIIKSKKEKNRIFKKIKNKQDINKIKVKNVLIGDLLYDTYLKRNYDLKPTIDIQSIKFQIFAENFLNLFFLWNEFIKKEKIDFVICSHDVYALGIPSRICTSRNCESFVVDHNKISRLTKKYFYKYSITKLYKKIFSEFKSKEKKLYILKAKNSLNQRFEGSIKDISYMTASSFIKNISVHNKKLEKVKNFKNKVKILVSPHDFVDAPHVYGNWVFPDMYEWIKFLAKLTKKTDYLWFIKAHPKMNEKYKSYQKYTRKVISSLIKESNFILLNPNTSHNHLINKIGIDCVLTVTGTIGHEYAAHGVNVINASPTNMHQSFNFNYHAKNFKHYNNLIMNIKKLNKKINYEEVLQCYFMHYIYTESNWFFKNFNDYLTKIKGYHNLSSIKAYEHWMNIHNEKEDNNILKRIDNFLSSKDLVFMMKHN